MSANRLAGLLCGLVLLASAVTCSAGSPSVTVGMTKSEVRARLGTPERIGVLNGKLIDPVPPDVESRVAGRLVYFYRDGQLAVWFQDGKVTGVVDSGTAGASDKQESDDH